MSLKSVLIALLLFSWISPLEWARPPPAYTPSPAEIDRSVERFVPLYELRAICGHPRALACYIPSKDLVYLPSDWPSKSELEILRIHEHAHRVKGWRH